MSIGKTTDARRRILAQASYQTFKQSLQGDDRYYAFVSYVHDSDISAAISSDTDTGELTTPEALQEVYRNTTTMHQILPGGISRVVRRVNWTRGNRYVAWSTSSDPRTDDFYVLSTEVIAGTMRQNVYKCLYAPDVNSTFPPLGIQSTPFRTNDGYWWQYMYTVSQSEAIRFLTEDWMPVPERITREQAAEVAIGTSRFDQLTVQNNARPGTVFNILPTQVGGLDKNTINVQVTDGLGGSTVNPPVTGTLTRDSDSSPWFFTLENYGIGYRGVPVIRDMDTDSDISSHFEAQVSPDQGHGYDAPNELGATDLMLVSRNIPDGEFLNLSTNDFRMTGLIRNPIDINTGTTALKNYYTVAHSIVLAGDATINEDDVITTTGGKEGRVVAVNGRRVWFLNTGSASSIFAAGDGILVNGIDISVDVEQYYTPEIISLSGEIIMVDYKVTPVERSQDQIESINIIMRF